MGIRPRIQIRDPTQITPMPVTEWYAALKSQRQACAGESRGFEKVATRDIHAQIRSERREGDRY